MMLDIPTLMRMAEAALPPRSRHAEERFSPIFARRRCAARRDAAAVDSCRLLPVRLARARRVAGALRCRRYAATLCRASDARWF